MELAPAPGGIHAAIVAIMGEIGAVEKGRTNTSQNYKYRGIADLYKACQPLMAAHGVHVVPHAILESDVRERESRNGGLLTHIRQRILFRFYHTDGSWIPCETVGEAMDSGDKAANKCLSTAVKYALIVTFAIPEEDPTVDIESASPEAMAKARIATPPALAAVEVAQGRAMEKAAAAEMNGAQARAAAERASKPGTVPPEIEVPDGQVPVFMFRNGAWEHAGGFDEPISKDHHKRVKALQKELGITETVWRQKLVAYYGKNSSTHLSDPEGLDLASRLEALKKAKAG